MSRKLKIALVVLVVLLLSALVGIFVTIFEQYDSERDIGLKGEAAFNPLIAAQRFLEKSGIETESVVSMLELKDLPGQRDILFLATRRFDIGPALRDKIMAWVSDGGHLIIVAWPESDSDSELHDPLLEQLNISVHYDDFEWDVCEEKNTDVVQFENNEFIREDNKNSKPDQKNSSDKEKIVTTCADNENQPLEVTILQDREKSKVNFNPSIWLTSTNEDKANWVVNSENGAHLVEYLINKGLVTVLSDYDFLTTTQLKKFDHAAFLWYLVHYSNNSGKVWIVYKGDMPPLYVWLIKNVWAPLLAFGFIIIIWIWSVLPRFGALYPVQSSNRRHLIEHIRASGQFLWKNKYSDGLIHETRNALQEQITKRHPNWNKLTETELVIRLAKQSGLSSDSVELALTTPSVVKEQEFTLIIQTLERLRKSI